jgi:hypothetical protein
LLFDSSSFSLRLTKICNQSKLSPNSNLAEDDLPVPRQAVFNLPDIWRHGESDINYVNHERRS